LLEVVPLVTDKWTLTVSVVSGFMDSVMRVLWSSLKVVGLADMETSGTVSSSVISRSTDDGEPGLAIPPETEVIAVVMVSVPSNVSSEMPVSIAEPVSVPAKMTMVVWFTE
jgi:hypothetical protein